MRQMNLTLHMYSRFAHGDYRMNHIIRVDATTNPQLLSLKQPEMSRLGILPRVAARRQSRSGSCSFFLSFRIDPTQR